jgi:histone-lysine N-methyltransferase SETMAR
MEKEGVFLLHDNATPHTLRISEEVISRLGFIQLSHPPYSPDLAPSDLYLFPKLKKHLANKTLSSNEEVVKKVKKYLRQKKFRILQKSNIKSKAPVESLRKASRIIRGNLPGAIRV